MSKSFLATIAKISLCVVIAFGIVSILGIFLCSSDAIASQAMIALSFATVGLVVAGKEIESVKSLEDLQELRNGLVKQMGELRDKFTGRKDDASGSKGRFEGEERSQWDQANEGMKAIDAQMEELRNSDSIEARWAEIQEQERRSIAERKQRVDINDPDSGRIKEITVEDRQLAMQSWFRCQMEMPLSKRHKEACKKIRFNPRRSRLDTGSPVDTEVIQRVQAANRFVHASLRPQATNRAMSGTTATDGKEFIPQGFMLMMEEALFLHANIRNVVDIMRTDSGNEIPWPTSNDQDEGEWLGESAPVTESDPDTDNVLFNAHKIGSKLIKVPTELLEDSAFNLATWLPVILGRRIGRGINRAGTTGDGVGKPAGIVTGSLLGFTPATNALGYSDFVKLEHSVDPIDRANGGYMFHDDTLLLLRLLVDADGRPLWQPGMQSGTPDRFLNRPYEINQYMDKLLTTGQKPVVFGNFQKYKLREVKGIRLYRLQEAFRVNDQDGFVGFQRFDGKIVDAGTGPIRHIVMP